MAACLVLGVRAARARDLRAHRAWMIRAYAIGLAAGTQVLTEGVGTALFGTGEVRGDLAKGAGWVDQPRRRRVGHPSADAGAVAQPTLTARTGQWASRRMRWALLPRISLPTGVRRRRPITISSAPLDSAMPIRSSAGSKPRTS